mmetsp:Transcript_21121/g.31595  ORF Transcript_21121/g.31595 Transcript_21121/m.31595 type:complete len:454 (-) Transcript_21121:4-1365(-)
MKGWHHSAWLICPSIQRDVDGLSVQLSAVERLHGLLRLRGALEGDVRDTAVDLALQDASALAECLLDLTAVEVQGDIRDLDADTLRPGGSGSAHRGGFLHDASAGDALTVADTFPAITSRCTARGLAAWGLAAEGEGAEDSAGRSQIRHAHPAGCARRLVPLGAHALHRRHHLAVIIQEGRPGRAAEAPVVLSSEAAAALAEALAEEALEEALALALGHARRCTGPGRREVEFVVDGRPLALAALAALAQALASTLALGHAGHAAGPGHRLGLHFAPHSSDQGHLVLQVLQALQSTLGDGSALGHLGSALVGGLADVIQGHAQLVSCVLGSCHTTTTGDRSCGGHSSDATLAQGGWCFFCGCGLRSRLRSTRNTPQDSRGNAFRELNSLLLLSFVALILLRSAQLPRARVARLVATSSLSIAALLDHVVQRHVQRAHDFQGDRLGPTTEDEWE